jgi:hypothetical protein
MFPRLNSHRLTLGVLLVPLFWLPVVMRGAPTEAEAGKLKLEARLVFASNKADAPPAGRKLGAAFVKRYYRMYKWTNFYLVAKQGFAVATLATQKVVMSPTCQVLVKNLGAGRLECALFLRGKPLARQTSTVARGGSVVFGGNETDSGAWFVSLRNPVEDIFASAPPPSPVP